MGSESWSFWWWTTQGLIYHWLCCLCCLDDIKLLYLPHWQGPYTWDWVFWLFLQGSWKESTFGIHPLWSWKNMPFSHFCEPMVLKEVKFGSFLPLFMDCPERRHLPVFLWGILKGVSECAFLAMILKFWWMVSNGLRFTSLLPLSWFAINI